ncbi:hypothetical protein B0F90DRAFT_1717728 [Multifurca ochricompacta]|uniref:Uncharacterized protein n=1 Tax=Multifurca ochricompacta TaxID=376703 RepID=A0AAD4M6I5_9AGAM|nr:hypothetical protein B0F90DRAFT_1717728 [Multifurca ochricompacta]
MVEYVYALHDFVPEHDDEISFCAGERIEVVERDDLYGDGWWQGRNLAGKVGLFPESYTQFAPPSSKPPPAAVPVAAPPSAPAENGISPVASLSSPERVAFESSHSDSVLISINKNATRSHTSKTNGEVMRATMTDVQQAIEQLAHKDDFDGSRSFTFSSTRDESTDHGTDHETDTDVDGEDWHKSARQKLAEKAKKSAEKQAAREAAEGRVSLSVRSAAPPIDVELSDDSGDEEDAPLNGHRRRHSHIPEEDEEDTTAPQGPAVDRRLSTASIQPSERYIVPSPGTTPDPELAEDTATEAGISTATQPSFSQNERAPTPDNNNSSLPSPVSPVFPSKTQTLNMQEVAGVLPSPAASSMGHRYGYSISSAASSARVAASSPLSGTRSADLFANKKPRHVDSTDWTVEEVVDWLRFKGFDDLVCEKFVEQEITGDVLLGLDVNVLKSEIGIIAYGKRMRIANAIAELRRPPSVMSLAEQPARPESLSQGSPLTHPVTALGPATPGSADVGSLVSPESPPFSGDLIGAAVSMPARRDSDPGVRPRSDKATDSNATIGLGLGMPPSLIPGSGQSKAVKGRPAQLSLSPSDGALGANAKGVTVEQEEAEEDRAVLSDSDAKKFATKGSRPSLFARQNSTSSTSKIPSPRKSKESSTPRSDVTQLGESSRPRHERRKRSLDATRETSRLSIFGSTLAGTLGKSRKPPPRYSGGTEVEASPDRGTLSLSRLYHSSGSRKSSVRSSAIESGAHHGKEDKREKRESKDSGDSKEKRDPALLRKRTSSTTPDTLSRPGTKSGPGALKSGQNILEQIGTPDHNGWMRKKGEHYNTWKTRYFVLKGPHLYWLKSNSPSETKIKGYVNIIGNRIVTDESVDPGRYGFKLVHESDRAHYFSSDEQVVIREWMKALMKATIDRDYTKPVVSSVNIPTIPLAVAQAMNPAPRPPSPTARAATQKAMRRENTNQLSTRDAEILMGMGSVSPSQTENSNNGDRPRIETFFSSELGAVSPIPLSTSSEMQAPPQRPPRELRKKASTSEVRIAVPFF